MSQTTLDKHSSQMMEKIQKNCTLGTKKWCLNIQN